MALLNDNEVRDSRPERDAHVHVLVVDDNEGDFYLIKSLLEHAMDTAYEVSWARSVAEGFSAVGRVDPDICIVDYKIGAESGLDLIARLAASHPTLPTVLLTGQANHEIDVAAMRAGASDFLEKSRFDSQLLDRTFRYAIEQKRHERHLAALVERDDLTGLYNRAGFSEKLAAALAVADRTERMLAVLFLDLDRFKHVNDSLGHAAGDALLRAVGQRLVRCCRSTDVIARMGGDEFAIVATHLKNASGAGHLAEKILSAIAQPFDLSGHAVHVGVSIGVTTYPDDVGNADQLLMNADMALYRAKEDGRNRYVLFDAEMDLAAKARRRTESDLHHAIANDEFFLEYQPIVDARTGRLASLEALVRWDHSDGVRYPGSFIEIAETSNLIGPLGEWILHEACRTAARWASEGPGPMPVAINLSAAQLAMPNLLSSIQLSLAETGLPPNLLELEITESVMIPNLEGGQQVLKRLREMGVRVSIDDFGTGYTALKVLRDLPVDKLKIDRSFVAEITSPRAMPPIVKAVAEIGSSFGLEVVAEGVETAD
ncbi:MAG: EAL domain-containing protein, partial [Alphaproteobacteria bacterium]|nr:EAL domain-containing protein [Alphaproteobacteria bacterium]